MDSRLASVLTVLSVAITTIVVTAYAISPLLALYLAAVSGTALVAWLAFGRAGAGPGDGAVGPYLLTVPLVLALATCRYMGGAVDLLGGPLRDAGALVVATAQMFAGIVICQRLLRPLVQPATPEGRSLTRRQRNLWTLLFASVVGIYAVALYRSSGALPLVIVVGSMLGGLVGWRLTTAIRPIDPARAVPVFLVLLTLFYIHVGEESLTQFNRGIAMLTDRSWSDHDFTLLIGLAGPVVFFFSAWSLWKRQAFGNFVFWFFVVGMILGEPTHFLVFPLVSMQKLGGSYQYFPGMYTALFPMIPAIVGLVMIVSEHRSSRRPSW